MIGCGSFYPTPVPRKSSAKAEVDQTLADMEKKKADPHRAKMLQEKQFISAQEWDSARTA